MSTITVHTFCLDQRRPQPQRVFKRVIQAEYAVRQILARHERRHHH